MLEKILRKEAWTADCMLICLPGIGLVGSLTGELFIESATENIPLRELYPEPLLYVSVTSREGLITPPKITVNGIRTGELKGVIIVRGVSQPTNQFSQYELARRLVDVAEASGVRIIIGIGGYAITRVGEKRRVYISSTSWRISMLGASLGFLPLRGTVVGAAGLIPGLASLHGLDSACILVETNGESPDLAAAKTAHNSVLSFFKKYFSES
ncbi:MAG: PAC2 family protein [Thermoproteota archaeon]